jgi:cytochrome P450
MSANDDDHARQRKLLSNAFSDQALREQEPVLRSYADLLVKQLREHSDASIKGVDMVEWFTFTTFDIIGDLSLGSSFGNLANKKAHPWVLTFKSGIKQGILFVAFQSLGIPLFDTIIRGLVSPILQRKRHEQFKYAQAAVTERLSIKTQRPDFMTNFLRYNDTRAASRDEIDSIFTFLTLAGCESPATALSGATYYLLSNPSALKKLQDEIRCLPTDDDITIANLSRLPYLKAVLDESLRIYPPVPAAMDRVVPAKGKVVSTS